MVIYNHRHLLVLSNWNMQRVPNFANLSVKENGEVWIQHTDTEKPCKSFILSSR